MFPICLLKPFGRAKEEATSAKQPIATYKNPILHGFYPFCSQVTASLKALRAPQRHLIEIKELPLEDPVSEEKGVEEEQKQGTSSSMVGEKSLQLTEEPHRDIPEGEERLPPRLEGQEQEQHEEDDGPFGITDVFQGTLHNRKR